MNQLFHNIAGGTVHQIRREKTDNNIRSDCSVKRIVTALMPSLLFHCFSLFLPHLRTLAQEKRSQNCLRFWTGGQSLCLYQLLSRNIIFSPSQTTVARAKEKHFWRIDLLTLCSRYQRALSRFCARLRILNLIASNVIIANNACYLFLSS